MKAPLSFGADQIGFIRAARPSGCHFPSQLFSVLETYVTLLHVKSRIPFPVIRVMHGKDDLLHLDLKAFLIKLH